MINKVEITDDQYDSLMDIFSEHPRILNSSDFLKINRSVSYMTFIIKELFDYYTAKTTDGIPLYKLKSIVLKMDALRESILYMKKFIRK